MSGEEKLETCRHRSNILETKNVNTCCDIWKEKTGFNCNERNIFPLNPNICVHCGLYEQKEV